MTNISDGIKDGIVIMYCKDGTIYPVGLKKEELEMLDITIGLCFQGHLTIVNQPMGKSVLLKK